MDAENVDVEHLDVEHLDAERELPAASRIAELEQRLSALSREVETLQEALESRTLIARATGLLAAGLKRPMDDAWLVMRQTSSFANVKLRDVARLLILAHDGAAAPGDEETAARIAKALERASTPATST